MRQVICDLDTLTPLTYLNIFEEGDVWIQSNHCDGCPDESRKKCCDKCPAYVSKGCFYHLEMNNKDSNKPWRCVVNPYPDNVHPYCQVEFECMEGPMRGKIRRVRDKRGVFI